ncbi:unnamed protein product [Toxocara canis]|uniref:Uncharacterized protein n=1 Tax=Toxocara canis TaxID=6265 RepID=A0A3P7GTT7_TOXCA|nr:unnamed protein product [Toxocara canis]
MILTIPEEGLASETPSALRASTRNSYSPFGLKF